MDKKHLVKIVLKKQKQMGLINLKDHHGSKVSSGSESGCQWEVYKDTEGTYAYKVDGNWSHSYSDPFVYDSESECVADAKSDCKEKAARMKKNK